MVSSSEKEVTQLLQQGELFIHNPFLVTLSIPKLDGPHRGSENDLSYRL